MAPGWEGRVQGDADRGTEHGSIPSLLSPSSPACRPWAKNTAEGAAAFPPLLSCPAAGIRPSAGGAVLLEATARPTPESCQQPGALV